MARKKNNQVVKTWEYDSDPAVALDVNPDTGVVQSWMAFDPKYGPETQEQIDWHVKRGTPGANTWDIGVPCDTPGFKAQKKNEEAVAA